MAARSCRVSTLPRGFSFRISEDLLDHWKFAIHVGHFHTIWWER